MCIISGLSALTFPKIKKQPRGKSPDSFSFSRIAVIRVSFSKVRETEDLQELVNCKFDMVIKADINAI